MFKKIEIWILYLVLILGLLFALGFGVLVRQEIEGITKAGPINISFLSKPAAYLARLPEQFLFTIFKGNPSRVNNFFEENRSFYTQIGFEGTPNKDDAYLLLSKYDGELQESVVELIDLTDFSVMHVWNPDIDAINELVNQIDEFENLDKDANNFIAPLRHPKLTKDFGLIFNGSARKINACSELVFQNTHDIFHHSIETDIDGNIWVPSHIFPPSLPIEKVGYDYKDDAIVQLSSNGSVIYEKSVSQIFIDNNMEHLLFAVGDPHFDKDPIHLNDIQPVDFDGEYWKKGDIFISPRHQSMILLYRPATDEIIWQGSGPFFHQHDVNIIDNHKISVFNNNSKHFNSGDIVDGHNQVIIYNFKTNKYSSYLENSLIENDVRTITQGRSEILPNGDLFVEETNYGRTLYFNADGSLRWTHVNATNNGEVYVVNWSRIMYTKEDIQLVKDFLKNKDKCYE